MSALGRNPGAAAGLMFCEAAMGRPVSGTIGATSRVEARPHICRDKRRGKDEPGNGRCDER